jgi:hypothetical protein
MKATIRIGLALFGTAICYSACASTPQHVSAGELTQQYLDQIVGKTISVHGCIEYNTEGETLGPCSSNANSPAIFVETTAFPFTAPLSAAFKNDPHGGGSQCIEGDFVGVIVQIQSPWHSDVKLAAINLKSYQNVSLCKA